MHIVLSGIFATARVAHSIIYILGFSLPRGATWVLFIGFFRGSGLRVEGLRV